MLKFLVFQRITWIKSADLEWNIVSSYSASLEVALSIYERVQPAMPFFLSTTRFRERGELHP